MNDPTPKDHSEAEELKSCPFCGVGAVIFDTHEPTADRPFYAVACPQCHCMTTEYAHLEHAVEAWNTRHNPEVERLIKEVEEKDKIYRMMDEHAVTMQKDLDAARAEVRELSDENDRLTDQKWCCCSCGNTNDFTTVTNGHPLDPPDYDIECDECKSTHVTEIEGAARHLILEHDTERAKLEEQIAHQKQVIEAAEAERDQLKEMAVFKEAYLELIMCVERKFPNETRHQTALRYIKSIEKTEQFGYGSYDPNSKPSPPNPVEPVEKEK